MSEPYSNKGRPVRPTASGPEPGKASNLPLGFTPVPNKRINGLIAETALAVMDERPELTTDLEALHAIAVRRVAQQLPAPAFERRHRAPRPSRSDNPAYRKLSPARAMAR